MHIRALLASIALLLLPPSVALASLVDEQHQGQVLVAQLQSGAKSCSDLSTDDFDHIGEYVMGRAVGSTSAHEALNQRMRAMMGDQAEGRMHQLMGARYVNCTPPAASGNGYGSMMGSGMMGGGSGSTMMNSRDWSWMMGGAWQGMSRQDWQRLQQRLLGANTSTDNGPSGWTIAAIALAAVVLGGVIALLATHRGPFRRPPAATSPS